MCWWCAEHQQTEDGLGSECYLFFFFFKVFSAKRHKLPFKMSPKYPTFSVWGNRENHPALFSKTLAWCIFTCLAIKSLPISSISDIIYYLQGKGMTSFHVVIWGSEKWWESLLSTHTTSLPVAYQDADLEPCSFLCSFYSQKFPLKHSPDGFSHQTATEASLWKIQTMLLTCQCK